MPKSSKKETPKQQAARFAAEVERMIAAGELNPTEADDVLSELVKRAQNPTFASGS
jgi:polyhydroxyalkanoate synthesis regulator phasin